MAEDGSDQRAERRAVLLCEYQAAQASAHHHDALIWTITTIVWGANFVVLGTLLRASTAQSGPLGLCLLAVVGLLLTIFVFVAQDNFQRLKEQKYARCKAIEQELGMSQHLTVDHERGRQTKAYRIVMAFFLLAWLLVFVSPAFTGWRFAEHLMEFRLSPW